MIFSLSVVSIAQTKTVTNADLEKFRQERLKAEREYRENYERLGFPSPAEREREIEESRIRREKLSAQLKAERLQREAIEAQEKQNSIIEKQNQYFQTNGYQTGENYYNYAPYGYTAFYGGRYSRHRRFSPRYNQQVYPASGFLTVNQLRRVYTGQPFQTNNRNFRFRSPRPIVKINIGGGRRY